MSGVEVLVIVLAVAHVAAVVELLRRRQLVERYAMAWMALGALGVAAAIARPLIDDLADGIGVSGASLAFAAGLLALGFLAMSLTVSVSRLEDRVEVLAEEVAVARAIVDDSATPD